MWLVTLLSKKISVLNYTVRWCCPYDNNRKVEKRQVVQYSYKEKEENGEQKWQIPGWYSQRASISWCIMSSVQIHVSQLQPYTGQQSLWLQTRECERKLVYLFTLNTDTHTHTINRFQHTHTHTHTHSALLYTMGLKTTSNTLKIERENTRELTHKHAHTWQLHRQSCAKGRRHARHTSLICTWGSGWATRSVMESEFVDVDQK